MKRIAFIIIACLVAGDVCQARIITVDDDGPADFSTIQAAIDDANDGDTVTVRPGRYTGEGNRDISFRGKGITVRSLDPNDPNIVHGTVIDADANQTDEHRCFVFANAEGPSSVLDGLTITGGFTTSEGGGIRCIESGPTIARCCIEGNCALEGGGFYSNKGCPNILSCTIQRNTARYGGGMSCYSGSLSVSYCRVLDNIAESGGGLFAVYSGVTAAYSVFRGNQSYSTDYNFTGGGFFALMPFSEISVEHCLFEANSTLADGGGGLTVISCKAGAEISNCTFVGNGALSGAALSLRGGNSFHPIVRNCIVWGNIPSNDPGIYSVNFGFCGRHYAYIDHSVLQADWDQLPLAQVTNCMVADPCFADPGYWDPNGTPDDANDDFWVDGDYHLKSQCGRWEPNEGRWTIDEVTSPCIDAGDPMSPIGLEPFPNGGRINMGAYGGTEEASKSYFGGPVCETIVAGDVNGDCLIDFKDFFFVALHWMEEHN